MNKYQNGVQKGLLSNLKFDSTAGIESESVEASTSLFTEMKKDENVIHNSKRLREINKINDKTDLKHALYIIRTVLSQFDWNNSIIFHIKKEDSFYKIVFSEIKKRITDNVIEEIKNVNYKKFCLCIVKDVYIDSGNVVVEINKIEHKQYFRELEQEKIQKYLDDKIRNAKYHHGTDKKQNGNLISYMGIENANGSNSSTQNSTTRAGSSNFENMPTQYDKKRNISQLAQNNTNSFHQAPANKNFNSQVTRPYVNSNNISNDQMRGSLEYTNKKRRVEVQEEISTPLHSLETKNYKSVVTSSINTNGNTNGIVQPVKNDFFAITSEDHEEDGDDNNDADNSERNKKKTVANRIEQDGDDDETGDDSSDNLGTVVQRFFRLK